MASGHGADQASKHSEDVRAGRTQLAGLAGQRREVRAPELVRWLADYKRTLRHRAADDFVCQMHVETGEGWRYPTSTAVHARLRQIYQRAGVKGKRATHALRHRLAADLVSANVPIHAAQKILGHSHPSITLGVYAKARRSDIVEAGDQLENFRKRAS